MVSHDRWKEARTTSTPRDDGPRWCAFVGGDVDGARGVDVLRAARPVVDVLHRAFVVVVVVVVAFVAGKVGVDGARDASGRTRGGAGTVFARVGCG